MKRTNFVVSMIAVALSVPALVEQCAAQYGAEVVSYDEGSTPTAGYTNAAAAVGAPERFTGEGVFPGVVSAFNPPFLDNEIVSVGEGGHITVKLSHYVLPRAGREIGVFENVGLNDANYPNGQATMPASVFGSDFAFVDVSEDGISWTSLGPIMFEIPSNGYTNLTSPYSDSPGSESDFRQPFTGDLSSFNGLPYSDGAGPDILEVLNGSGGGTWLDISGTGLPRVGYVRFSVPNDASATLNFELDAVSIANGAAGGIVPEPGTITLGCLLLLAMANLRHRGSRAVRA
jgi:hypothetical protein